MAVKWFKSGFTGLRDWRAQHSRQGLFKEALIESFCFFLLVDACDPHPNPSPFRGREQSCQLWPKAISPAHSSLYSLPPLGGGLGWGVYRLWAEPLKWSFSCMALSGFIRARKVKMRFSPCSKINDLRHSFWRHIHVPQESLIESEIP